MLKNYLLVSLRTLQRQRLFSLINLSGLTIGLSAALLIAVYVTDELSYDRFHEGADRIYRVGMWDKSETGISESARSCAPLLENLITNMPEIENGTRFGIWKDIPVIIGNDRFAADELWIADSNFFTFFTYPLIHGDPKSVLQGVNKVVLTKKAAQKYFGETNPVGQTFEITTHGVKRNVEVTGLAQNPPPNSHLQFDIILSGESWKYFSNDYWLNTQNYTYLKTYEPQDPDELSKKISSSTRPFIAKDINTVLGYSFEKFQANGGDIGFFIQPMKKIHLYSSVNDEITANGNVQIVFIFSGVAVLILILAITNFINLYTARSAGRAKEVGVRKISGATASRLRMQFITEAIFFALLAGIMALLLSCTILPFLNSLTGYNFQTKALFMPSSLGMLLLVTILVGLTAGFYPAFYLSSFQPSEVLKGKVRAGFGSSVLRNYLIIFQFSVAIIMITASLVMLNQFNYMRQKSLGFGSENVIIVKNADQLAQHSDSFVKALSSNSAVLSTSFSNHVPPYVEETGGFRLPGNEKDVTLTVFQTDANMLSTLGFEMKDGRFFSDEIPSDSAAVILNESAMKLFGWQTVEDQKLITFFRGLEPRNLNLIGVVNDFHYSKLYNEIRPMAILLGPKSNSTLAIKISPGSHANLFQQLDMLGKKFAVTGNLEYEFMDTGIQQAYERDQRNANIISTFTAISIFIAILGLFGLANFTVERRAKEISIRKILGASFMRTLIMLNKDFLRLVIISMLVAVPISINMMSEWLTKFPYRKDIDLITVLSPGMIIFLLTLIVVSFQSWNTVRENPTVFLKNE